MKEKIKTKITDNAKINEYKLVCNQNQWSNEIKEKNT